MKKQPFNSPELSTKVSFADTLNEHPLMHWISENGRTLIYILIGLIALFVVIYRFSAGKNVKAENDYLSADAELSIFQNGVKGDDNPAIRQNAFEKLDAILKRHPELHPKYDGLIAQTFINQHDGAEAQKFGTLAINRTLDENRPFFSDFAQITLLIAQAQYNDALKRSIELKDKMLESTEKVNSLLFAWNLTRIAFLQQQTEAKEEELKTWQLWKQFAGLSGASPSEKIETAGFFQVSNAFQEGSLSLLNYLEMRENALK